MSKNFLIEATDSNGNSFLHFAAAKGHLERLVYLIKNGSSVNAVNVFGWTPLMQAVRNGQTDAARLLISNGADVIAKNDYGLSILSLSVVSNNRETVELILSIREKISWTNDIMGPLTLAIIFNSQSIIELLLSKPEFSLNSPDPITFLTPTTYAFLTKKYDLLNSLLKKSHSDMDMLTAKDSAIIAQIPNRKNSLEKVKFRSYNQVPFEQKTNNQKMFRLSDSNQIQNWIRDLGGQMKRCHLSENIPKSSFNDYEEIIEGDDDVFEDESPSSVVVPNRSNEKQALRKLLRTHSLDSYMSLFEKHEIDLDVLLTLSDTDLHEIGINCPDKRRLFLEMIFKLSHEKY